MRVPAFELINFGRFDSHIAIPGAAHTDFRTVKKYEIDIFSSDQTGHCFIDSTTYFPARGMILCAKPGQKRRSVLPLQCYYIHITTEDPELLRMLDALPDCMFAEDLDSLLELFQDPDVVSDRENPNRAFLRQGYVYKFLHRLFQLQAGTVSEVSAALKASPAKPHQATLLRVSDYIRAHLSEPLSLVELASLANLSPNYFHRLFTARFGRTPNHYITDQRIRAARAKLAYSDQSLAQIAMECGFSSQSYFTCRFTKETGKSPLQYRKEMQSRILP